VDITNNSKVEGEEVVQLYLRDLKSEEVRPLKDLRGFVRVHVNAGQTVVATMSLGPDELAYYDTSKGDYIVEPGAYEILVGPSSQDSKLLVTDLLVR